MRFRHLDASPPIPTLAIVFLLAAAPVDPPPVAACRSDEVVFFVGDELDVRGTLPGSIRLTGLPATPVETVERLFAAFAARQVDAYMALLADEYRFASDDPSFAAAFPDGITREVERETLLRLFGLVGREPGLPFVRSVTLSLGPIEAEAGWAPPGRGVRVFARRVDGELRLSDGSTARLGGSVFEFEVVMVPTPHTVRGARPAAPGLAATAPTPIWRIRRAFEWGLDPVAAPVATADSAGAAPESARAVPPLRLAIRALGPGAGADGTLELTLTSREPARLEWFDVQGRRCAEEPIAEPAPGSRRVAGPAGRLASGVYWARLRQGRADATTRVVVLR